MNGAVGTDGHGHTQRINGLQRAGSHRDDFVGHSGLAKLHRFFNGDFIERVHRHLGDLGIHTGMIGQRTHLDLGVHHAFDGDEDLHQKLLKRSASEEKRTSSSAVFSVRLIITSGCASKLKSTRNLQEPCFLQESTLMQNAILAKR